MPPSHKIISVLHPSSLLSVVMILSCFLAQCTIYCSIALLSRERAAHHNIISFFFVHHLYFNEVSAYLLTGQCTVSNRRYRGKRESKYWSCHCLVEISQFFLPSSFQCSFGRFISWGISYYLY